MRLEFDLSEEQFVAITERIAALTASHLIEQLNELEPHRARGYLNVPQAAEFLSCSKNRIYTLVSVDRLPHYKDGSRVLFKLDELDDYVRRGGAKSP